MAQQQPQQAYPSHRQAVKKTSVPRVIIMGALTVLLSWFGFSFGIGFGNEFRNMPEGGHGDVSSLTNATTETGGSTSSPESSPRTDMIPLPEDVSSYLKTQNPDIEMLRLISELQSGRWEIGDQESDWYVFAESGKFAISISGRRFSGTYDIRLGQDALSHMDEGVANDIRQKCEEKSGWDQTHVFLIQLEGGTAETEAISQSLCGVFERKSADNGLKDTLWVTEASSVGRYLPLSDLPGNLFTGADGA